MAHFGSISLLKLILQNESQAPQFIGERAEHFGAKNLKFKIKILNVCKIGTEYLL